VHGETKCIINTLDLSGTASVDVLSRSACARFASTTPVIRGRWRWPSPNWGRLTPCRVEVGSNGRMWQRFLRKVISFRKVRCVSL
jgi:hypothetical protein